MKVAVLGYGNLGKAMEKAVERDEDTTLFGIFSRRTLDHEKYFPAENLCKYRADIDCVAVCLGSFADTVDAVKGLAGKFNTVDSFDNHHLIGDYKQSLAERAGDKLSVVSVGWDPGVMSMERALFSACGADRTAVFWGKGISQGHTNAVKSVEGVTDAVQFTVPIRRRLQRALRGDIVCDDFTANHKRLCFVATKGDKKKIAGKIKNIPDYFARYETHVRFVSEEKVRKLKAAMAHKGVVASVCEGAKLTFSLETESNPDFTARIMLAYIKAVPRLLADGFCGCLDCLDIPIRYIAEGSFL